jgi:hypothetical protein
MTEAIQELLEKKFPLPFVLVLLGYSFILLIDRVLIDSHDQIEVIPEVGLDYDDLVHETQKA